MPWQKGVLLFCFIIGKRFSVEMDSVPKASDVAELILGLLSAKTSHPQDGERERLWVLPVGWLQRQRVFSGKEYVFIFLIKHLRLLSGLFLWR